MNTKMRGQIRKAQKDLSQKERWRKNTARANTYNPEKRLAIRRTAQRRYWLKHQFGISLEDHNALLEAQGGACAICGHIPSERDRYRKGKSLALDHDHKTNKIRGLLCDLCNRAIGQLQDSPTLLRKAADYLELHQSQASSGISQ